MATCPQCRGEVGWRAVMFPSALAGIVCPGCRASLEPHRGRYAVLNGLAVLAGFGLYQYVRQAGHRFPWPLLAYAAGHLLITLLFHDAFVRLRPKRPTLPSIRVG